MAKSNTHLEIEVKLACDSVDALRNAGLDLSIVKPRYFEDNWLFDFADQRLFKTGAALRVRKVENQGLVTYKGIVMNSATSPLKVREEIETEVAQPEHLATLFERLGLHRSFRYQKYRTDYRVKLADKFVSVTFDETPMGNFIEIEGDETEVLAVMQAAGFRAEDIIRESYPELQVKRCREIGIPVKDLVF
ncbi:MAG: class IV adenylate cyclase [Acidobacteriota bacterium]